MNQPANCCLPIDFVKQPCPREHPGDQYALNITQTKFSGRMRAVYTLVALGAFVAAALSPSQATGQEPRYPARPVRLIIPVSPGSPTDTYTRRIASVAQVKLGAPIVIENRAGAGSVIGATQLARSAADGYTLMASTSVPFIASTVLIKSVPYDSMTDFRYITKLFVSTPVLVASTASNVDSLKALIAQARARSITFGSFGPGSIHQLSLDAFSKQAGIAMVEVPYRAPAQAMQAVLANEVALGYTAPVQAIQYRDQGLVKILAAIGTQRLALLPQVPTFVESGFDAPSLRTSFWTGIVGRAGTPEAVVATIHNVFSEALRDPQIEEFFARVGNRLIGNSPQDFEREIREEFSQLVPILKALNIQPE